MLMVGSPYQVAAMRSGPEAFCKARISDVLATHVVCAPSEEGTTYEGFWVRSPTRLYPSAPYFPFQFPCVVVSKARKLALAPAAAAGFTIPVAVWFTPK